MTTLKPIEPECLVLSFATKANTAHGKNQLNAIVTSVSSHAPKRQTRRFQTCSLSAFSSMPPKKRWKSRFCSDGRLLLNHHISFASSAKSPVTFHSYHRLKPRPATIPPGIALNTPLMRAAEAKDRKNTKSFFTPPCLMTTATLATKPEKKYAPASSKLVTVVMPPTKHSKQSFLEQSYLVRASKRYDTTFVSKRKFIWLGRTQANTSIPPHEASFIGRFDSFSSRGNPTTKALPTKEAGPSTFMSSYWMT